MAATTNGDFGEIGFQAEEEAAFGDVIDAALQDETPGLNSMGDAAGEAKDEFDDPKGEDLMEQDEQPKTQEKGESESDSDGEGTRHRGGKFVSERTGVISLTPTTTRDKIPETLEINKEQAAQIQHFLSDKTNKGRGKMRGVGRASSQGRLGVRPGVGPQQNQQLLLGQIIRGILSQQNRMRFPFPNGQPNRGPFPAGNRGPFPFGLVNQRGPFSGGLQNQRGPSILGSGPPRGPFQTGALNVPVRGPQRAPLFNFPHGRFPGAPNQGVQFLGGQQTLGSQRVPQLGPRPILGPSPNLQRPQSFPNQRGINPGQFAPQPSLLGPQGIRVPLPGQGNSGQRPPLLNTRPGMGFVRPPHPSEASQQGQSVPSLINQVANALKTSLELQQMRPSLMGPRPGTLTPQPRLGQNMNRFQRPGLPQGPPRFMARTPGPSGPPLNPALIRGIQQSLLRGAQMIGKQKAFMNPRFPGQQAAFGNSVFGRTVRMGVPLQQRKAKALLERAKQTQNKQPSTVPMKLTGIKRKSTGEDDVPSKVVKPDEEDKPESAETPAAASDQADSGPKGEVIQRMEELAVQEQADTSTGKPGTKLEKGTALEKISEDEQTGNKIKENQDSSSFKQMSGPVVTKSGTAPEQNRNQPAVQRASFSRPTSVPGPKPQQFQQRQNFQMRAPVVKSAFSGQPRTSGASSMGFKGPALTVAAGFIEQLSKNLSRFSVPSSTNQFKIPQSNFSLRNTDPKSLQNETVTVSRSNTRFGGLQPAADFRLRWPSGQGNTQSSSINNQTQKFTATTPARSVPPPSSLSSQQFQSQYTPASTPSTQSPSSYAQFNQSNSAPPSLRQNEPHTTGFHSSGYPPHSSQQYDTVSPTEESLSFSQNVASQYQFSQQHEYQTPATAHYQTSASQYQTTASHYQTENPQFQQSAMPQYQTSAVSNYETSSASHYQTSTPSLYQTSASSLYQTSTSPLYQSSPSSFYQSSSTSQYHTSSTPQFQTSATSQYQTSTSQFQTSSNSQYQASSTPPFQSSTTSQYQSSSAPQFHSSTSHYQTSSTPQFQTSAVSQYQSSSTSQYLNPSSSHYPSSTSHQTSTGLHQDSSQFQNQQYPPYNTSSDLYYQNMDNGYYT